MKSEKWEERFNEQYRHSSLPKEFYSSLKFFICTLLKERELEALDNYKLSALIANFFIRNKTDNPANQCCFLAEEIIKKFGKTTLRLPEEKIERTNNLVESSQEYLSGYLRGYNEAIDKVKELNS